jgi:hypothetical protein
LREQRVRATRQFRRQGGKRVRALATGNLPGEFMGYYPIFIDVSGWRCVVIGGGFVAQRRVEGLLAADAKVTVVEDIQPLRQAVQKIIRGQADVALFTNGAQVGHVFEVAAQDGSMARCAPRSRRS